MKNDIDTDQNSDSSMEQPGDSSENTTEMAKSKDNGNHLDEIPDGAGCTEIWEHLSQGRDD